MTRPLAVACVAFAAAIAAVGCTERGAPNPDARDVMEAPEQVSHGFVLTRSDGGLKKWDLKAAEGKVYSGGDLAVLTDLTLDFYDSTGTLEGTLTAGRGRAHKPESRIEVESKVILKTVRGGELRTDSLAWSETTGQITTDAYVEIDRDGERLTGWGLTARPDLSFAEVKRGVTVSGNREER